jgi:hypothetical protein
MSDNDKIILNSILDRKKAEDFPTLPDDDYFELFVNDQLLKKYDLSDDEINDGNVGGGGDGQIDGFFTFLNGELLQEDTELKGIKRAPIFEIFIIQAKRSDSFSEVVIERITQTISNIFNLSKNAGEFHLYNSQLVEKVELFKTAYKEVSIQHPKIILHLFYATKGDTERIHTNVHTNARLFKETFIGLFPGSDVKSNFIGARELIDSFNTQKEFTLKLNYYQNTLSTGENNYIVLSSLVDYFTFVTDNTGELLKHIFEANVRDYQGNVAVNKDISSTLQSTDENIDFWWLNNGITIIASHATIHGYAITLDNVYVVNGLQTTREIWIYLKNKGRMTDSQDKNRRILIKIIITTLPEIQDRIIKATNFQTKISFQSLRATDRLQRDIETYFSAQGWFYDRRKNFYKNTGKPASKIIGIPLLSQVLMALLLKEPFQARSRPTAIVKKDSDYKRLFNDKIQTDIYLNCAKVIKNIESVIRIPEISKHTTPNKSSFRFHSALVLVMMLLKKKNYSTDELGTLPLENINPDILSECFNQTIDLANKFSSQKHWDLNRISKSPEFNAYLIQNVKIPK